MIFAQQLADIEWDGDDLEDGDMLMDVIVVARFTRMSDGETGVFTAKSRGCDGVVQTGLIAAARQIDNANPWRDRE